MEGDDPKAGESAPDGALSDRVSKLEDGQDTLAGKLDQLIGMVGGGGAGGGEAAGAGESGGGSVAGEIRQQLEARDRERAASDRERATSDRLGALETKLSELAETKPGPLPRRVEKLMGWR